PRPMTDTCRSVLPNRRYCICSIVLLCAHPRSSGAGWYPTPRTAGEWGQWSDGGGNRGGQVILGRKGGVGGGEVERFRGEREQPFAAFGDVESLVGVGGEVDFEV